jgi:cation transport protein ChaC
MWRPGFDHVEAVPARLDGAHRALCVYSWVHRGTREKPGLVLGLDRGGACRGIAFRVAPQAWDAAVAYLRDRELVTTAYREVMRPVHLLDRTGKTVSALTYVVDRRHEQYAGALAREALLSLVRQGEGRSGTNIDYVLSTAKQLRTLGLRDSVLDWLADQLSKSRG